MSYLEALSETARNLIRTRLVTGYATVSAAGVPVETSCYVFPSADLSTIAIATGLAYPAKAERARRNPKVGLVLEGRTDEPVISIAGHAAVRDADLQANMVRYIRETMVTPVVSPEFNDWDERVRPAVHYLTRLIVEVTPAHVRWWPNHAALDGPPTEWRAPTETVFPQSDPVPPGKLSPNPEWEPLDWREFARSAIESGWYSYLTLCDKDGYPLPLPTREVTLCDGGFRIVMAKAMPWSEGKATLSFAGFKVFIGDVTTADGVHVMKVERALPILPLTRSGGDVLKPDPEARERLMERLRHETQRRGQPIPTVPEVPPTPTELALVRGAHQDEWKLVREVVD